MHFFNCKLNKKNNVFFYFRGPNDERFGPRFFPTNDLYCHEYRKLARKVNAFNILMFLKFQNMPMRNE